MGGSTPEGDDHLTNLGKEQAERLGKNWSDVHIDPLHTSTLERAYDTALAIAKHNKDTNLKVIQKEIYVERKSGQAVIDAVCAGCMEQAETLYYGIPSGGSGATPRDYAPPRVLRMLPTELCLVCYSCWKSMARSWMSPQRSSWTRRSSIHLMIFLKASHTLSWLVIMYSWPSFTRQCTVGEAAIA